MSRIKNPCKALWCVTKCWRRLHGFACTHDHISFGTILYATNMTFGRRRCKLPATPPTRVEGSIDIQHKSGCLGYFEYALYMASECRMHVPTHCRCSIDILWRDKVTKHTELRFRNHRCLSRSIECMGNSSSIIPETNIEELEFRCLDVLHYCERLLRITPIRPYRRPVVHVCHVVH